MRQAEILVLHFCVNASCKMNNQTPADPGGCQGPSLTAGERRQSEDQIAAERGIVSIEMRNKNRFHGKKKVG